MSAAVHYVGMQYHKGQKQYAAFYRAALLYLAYISQEALPQEFRLVSFCWACPAPTEQRLPCFAACALLAEGTNLDVDL